MNIKERQNDVIQRFENLGDWMDKYEYLIAAGKSLRPIKKNFKNESNLIPGCQSKVWLASELKDGGLYFFAESDTLIINGMISLLLQVLNGLPPDVIANEELYFLESSGLHKSLSPTRANGLTSIVSKMKELALQAAEKSRPS